jgi:hypothetical protein
MSTLLSTNNNPVKLLDMDMDNILRRDDLPNDDLPNDDNLIFRYKFSAEIVEQLLAFAKLHQFDDRHVYKEEWGRWLTNNDTIINDECLRLKHLGYNGDVISKMYKSSRYYFRNKTHHDTKTRRKYISLDHDIIYAMDEHIHINYYLPGYKPSIAYEQFCIEYETLLHEEIERLLQENITDTDIQEKFKKTYKNRYYLFKQNRKNQPEQHKNNKDYELRNNTAN